MNQDTVSPARVETLRGELEETRQAYHELLASIPDNAWELPTANPAWTVRQMMYHITLALRFLPADVAVLRRGRSVPVPPWLFDRVNEWFTRFMGKRQTRASLAEEYDKRHAKVMALLDSIEPQEWDLAADYPDINRNLQGRQTIASMFHYIKVHFEEHEVDVRPALQRAIKRQAMPAGQIARDGQPGGQPEHPRRAPQGLSRLLFRAPLLFYRLGLGPLLGGRFLLLQHTGRKSGLPRQAVLEVVDHDAESDTYYVASGFGRHSQWFKNVQADTQVTIQAGARRLEARAEVLDPEASGEKMVDYARRYPAAARALSAVLGFEVDGSDEQYRRIAREAIPFVAFRPQRVLRERPAPREVAAMGVLVGGLVLFLGVAVRWWRRERTR